MTHPDFARAAALITSEAVRDVLVDLVDIPSPTGQEAGVARYLVERMRKSGLDTDLPMVDAGRPNAVGHLRGRGDGFNLLFTGHMDTSYSGEEEYLSGDGFKPKGFKPHHGKPKDFKSKSSHKFTKPGDAKPAFKDSFKGKGGFKKKAHGATGG